MAYKTAKNLLQNRDTYNAYYGDFRGVDFSSDHTQVHPNRLAYAVNMYKDYASAQGSCIETIAGFRRVLNAANKNVNGIHRYVDKDKGKDVALVHIGRSLYEWKDRSKTVGVEQTKTVALGENAGDNDFAYFPVGLSISDAEYIVGGHTFGGESLAFEKHGGQWCAKGDTIKTGDLVSITYIETSVPTPLYMLMNDKKSVSFAMNGKLYILDGKNYLVYDGDTIKSVTDDAFVPTTRVGIISQGDENGNKEGVQSGQKNLLQPKFKQTFRADGEVSSFVLTEKGASPVGVSVHGTPLSIAEYAFSGEKVDLFKTPQSDLSTETVYYNKYYEGVKIEYKVKSGGVHTNYFAPSSGEYILQETKAQTPEGARGNLVSFSVWFFGKSLEGLDDNDYSFETTTVSLGSTNDGYCYAAIKITPDLPSADTVVNYERNIYPKDYFGVEITASKPIDKIEGIGEIGAGKPITSPSDLITKCTIATVFDGRVFLSGNPMCPNRVFYCGRNDDGVADPSYFGEYDHFAEGSDAFAVKGLVPVADVLCVLKEESGQEGSVYYRTPTETSDNVVPKAYTGAEGIGSLGCVSACANFIDDPVFVSKRGVEAIGQLSVRYERAIEHRSSMVDAKLLNERLDGAFLEVWNGYLLLFVDGKVYMADSRQKYADDAGIAQYEWYYLEDIGVYDGQYEAYKYASEKDDACPYEIIGEEYSYVDGAYKDLKGTVANPNGEEVDQDGAYYYVTKGDHKYLCEPTGYMIGGDFKKPTCAKVIDGDLYFGTEGGHICKFNFDLRNADGELPIDAYSFDGRPILCGCATKMDNCGIPHLTKSTEKKSMVIKTKTLGASVLKIKVRTNKKPYEQVTRISSARFDFNELDFSDFSFVMSDQSLFMVREKEKKWVEKQIYLYSDEFCRPFALFYMAYRYSVTGRYKE